ncbi:hypothetical protein Scep_008410 [Stephania cephalantha]|uniref:F-box domain-containing protein n=1 Tax=Stephania cephalantha TaxID=152367 RepID=A0AAP0KBM1_9MAGN
MPALVNYSGEGNFCPGGALYANRPHVDVYYPPRKRSRITAPCVFKEESFGHQKLPSIDVLPDECLFEILRRLPGGQERSASACVSKRWLALLSSVRGDEICSTSTVSDCSGEVPMDVDSDGYLTRCLEGKKATDIRLCAIAVGTGHRGGLGKLMIRGNNSSRGVTDAGLSAISRGCPSLKTISIWNNSAVGDEGLTEIAKGCRMLEKLDLCQCPSISDKSLLAIAENCSNLRELTIESCSKIGNEGLQAIGQRCLKLQTITIKDCAFVGDKGVASLVSSASSSLKKLKLQALNITDVSLAVIGHYGLVISDLVLTGLQKVSERGFWVLGNGNGLHKLKSLTVTSCGGVTDLALEALAKGCSNLKQLHLRKCSFLSDNGMLTLAKTTASLECLQLEECNRITQSGIVNALTNCGVSMKALTLTKCMGLKDVVPCPSEFTPCRSLRSLAIRDCLGFGDAILAVVAKLCPELQNVDLSGVSTVTDAGLIPLLENCEAGLVKVNLNGCSRITDFAISAMARLHGGTLESLSLDGCKNVTDASLVALAENCSLLRDLDVSKCAVSDLGVATLSCAKGLDLQTISLSGCFQVSDKSMPCLANMSQTLIGLNLLGCSLISSSMMDLLVERLSGCDVLY